MNRSIFIDISKAICIVLVVIGHFHPPFSPEWYVALVKIIYTFLPKDIYESVIFRSNFSEYCKQYFIFIFKCNPFFIYVLITQ